MGLQLERVPWDQVFQNRREQLDSTRIFDPHNDGLQHYPRH